MPGSTEATMREQVEKVVEQLRVAVVQPDGGDLELVDVTEDGVVTIRLHGACVGCNSSTTTLRNGIERYLRHKLPQVTQVVAE
jgi:Fe-S cluster biogenesis protein NfuA